MKFWQIILTPVSILYGLITSIRNFLYDSGILKSKEFDIKIICVGNLSAGGTGKTPLVEYLIRLLKNDFEIATLSRGYGRKSSGFIIADEHSSAEDIGDEPRQYKQKFKDISVAVDGNRVGGIKKLREYSSQLNCILLDDAFQHRQVKAGLSIVLTDYSHMYMDDFWLPSGTLRESKKGINRADIIIITKTPESLPAVEKRRIMKDIDPRPYQLVYFSYIKYGDFVAGTENTVNQGKEIYFAENYHILLFTGIANNKPALDYLRANVKHVDVLEFSDHHKYNEKDISKIEQQFNTITNPKKLIITTEKDYMRLQKGGLLNMLGNAPFFYLPIETEFHQPDKEEFNQQILKYVRANKINSNTLEKYR